MTDLSDAQARALIDRLVEAASEHGELRTERTHVDLGDVEQSTQATVREHAARARMNAYRKALLIVFGVDPSEPTF